MPCEEPKVFVFLCSRAWHLPAAAHTVDQRRKRRAVEPCRAESNGKGSSSSSSSSNNGSNGSSTDGWDKLSLDEIQNWKEGPPTPLLVHTLPSHKPQIDMYNAHYSTTDEPLVHCCCLQWAVLSLVG